MIFSPLSSLSTLATTSPSRVLASLDLKDLSGEPSGASKQLWNGCTSFVRRVTPQVLHPTFDRALPIFDAVVERTITALETACTIAEPFRPHSPFSAPATRQPSTSPTLLDSNAPSTLDVAAPAVKPIRSSAHRDKMVLLNELFDSSRTLSRLSPADRQAAFDHARTFIDSEDGYELQLEQAQGRKRLSAKEGKDRLDRWVGRIKAKVDEYLASLSAPPTRRPSPSPIRLKGMQSTSVKLVARRSFHATSTISTGPLPSDAAQIVDLRTIRRNVHPLGPSFVKRPSSPLPARRSSTSSSSSSRREPSLRRSLFKHLTLCNYRAWRKAHPTLPRPRNLPSLAAPRLPLPAVVALEAPFPSLSLLQFFLSVHFPRCCQS